MIDVDQQISTTRRSIGPRTLEAGAARAVSIDRVYDTTVEDLWDACTDAERIPRWFLPISGELRVGGRYQLVGNAGGKVLTCDPPHSFTATWEFDGSVSHIEVRITPEGDQARLELTHVAPINEHWELYGPGATGVGWDLGLIGLTLHLASGGAVVDPGEVAAWTASEEGVRYMRGSSEAWYEADVVSGEDAGTARNRADATFTAYTTPPGGDPG